MRISLKQIEIFVAIAKTGNMSLAAEKLYLSQSACSMALATLENQLEGSLFDRIGKRLVLNERGTLIFAKAANIIQQTYELQDILLSNANETVAGELAIGASTTIGNYLLPSMISHFTHQYPQTKIKLEIGNTEEIIKRLLKFSIDIGMIEGNCLTSEIEVIPWRKDDLVIITAANHPLLQKSNLVLDDLVNSKWILREPGSGTREKLEEAVGIKLVPFLELSQTEAIKNAVSTGMGISCVSEATIQDAISTKQLQILPTPFLSLTRYFSILLHKNKHQTLVLEEFLKRYR